MEKQIHAVGKRKSSIARVYLKPRTANEGVIRINDRSFEDFFPRATARMLILQPFELTGTLGQFDVKVNVLGGGVSGQAGAVKHALARALLKVDANHRPILKRGGHLTRDAREVERKKYGLAGARRRFQYSKR
jgi:small subunit ribosomal protein S9